MIDKYNLVRFLYTVMSNKQLISAFISKKKKTYVRKGGIQVLRHQRGGWVGQMMMFDDKVGGWEWLNDDVIKKYTRKKKLFK